MRSRASAVGKAERRAEGPGSQGARRQEEEGRGCELSRGREQQQRWKGEERALEERKGRQLCWLVLGAAGTQGLFTHRAAGRSCHLTKPPMFPFSPKSRDTTLHQRSQPHSSALPWPLSATQSLDSALLPQARTHLPLLGTLLELPSCRPLAEPRGDVLSHGEATQHVLSVYYPRHVHSDSHNNPPREAVQSPLGCQRTWAQRVDLISPSPNSWWGAGGEWNLPAPLRCSQVDSTTHPFNSFPWLKPSTDSPLLTAVFFNVCFLVVTVYFLQKTFYTDTHLPPRQRQSWLGVRGAEAQHPACFPSCHLHLKSHHRASLRLKLLTWALASSWDEWWDHPLRDPRASFSPRAPSPSVRSSKPSDVPSPSLLSWPPALHLHREHQAPKSTRLQSLTWSKGGTASPLPPLHPKSSVRSPHSGQSEPKQNSPPK